MALHGKPRRRAGETLGACLLGIAPAIFADQHEGNAIGIEVVEQRLEQGLALDTAGIAPGKQAETQAGLRQSPWRIGQRQQAPVDSMRDDTRMVDVVLCKKGLLHCIEAVHHGRLAIARQETAEVEPGLDFPKVVVNGHD